ncbi:hypothetical protein [Burkholderia metallica]|uniref:hypothetical protein n=1 Tax=Burkholderia metallica TaxID=488729 RepID=UPI000AF477F2|nr:hypothetical protein [Burkholderia metallica]
MPSKYLKNALTTVDWNENVKTFISNDMAVEKISNASLRMAIWSKQLEAADQGNPALSFVREMQTAGQLVAASLSLALYRAAAGSIRSMLENALYYTFFRCHAKELETLVRNPKYFIDKNEIIDFHKNHTVDFTQSQQHLSLIGDLETWYSLISSIVHGQLPGIWNNQTELSKTAYDVKILESAVDIFCKGETIVHRLFLCTVARELWDHFSQTSKDKLLSGLDGKAKLILKLDGH